MLHAVCCYFNPNNYAKLKENYRFFRKNFKYPLTTVELALDNQDFFIDDAIHIKGNNRHILWQKERLLNLAIESLPKNIDKIVWVDTDIIFENDTWFQETEKKLENYPVIQAFETVSETSNDDNIVTPHKHGYGFAKSFTENLIDTLDHWPKCGLSWAFRRQCLPNGLYDKCVIGNGDALQLAAWMGNWDNYLIHLMSPKTRERFLLDRYQDYESVKANISYVRGNIIHLYHGNLENRQYFDRNWILIENAFDATTDISLDNNGLYQWSTHKPKLHQNIKLYFQKRKDDE
jgi:hypothetical protein